MAFGLDMCCLPMSYKKNASLIWVKDVSCNVNKRLILLTDHGFSYLSP